MRQQAENESLTLDEIDTTKSARDRSALEKNIAAGSHVIVCGPRNLVVETMRLARKRKAGSFAFEIYDYRSPFGPNLNPLLKIFLNFALPEKVVGKLNWLFENREKPEQVPSGSPH